MGRQTSLPPGLRRVLAAVVGVAALVLAGCAPGASAPGGSAAPTATSGGGHRSFSSAASAPPTSTPAPTAGPERASAAPTAPTATAAPTGAPTATPGGGHAAAGGGRTKVMVIAEENHAYGSVIGSPRAPQINAVAARYGLATATEAGYPIHCESLPAYILMTSGSTHGICYDRAPGHDLLSGDSIFAQVQHAGGEWRGYAQSMPGTCGLEPSGDYAPKHTPAAFYADVAASCARWQVPLGTFTSGALHDAVASGTLPWYSFVTPDLCHDMHAAADCPPPQVAAADAWLGVWLKQIVAGPDFRSGRLVVFVVWDEGSGTSNHIPLLVLSTETHRVRSGVPYTLCSVLRTSEQLLRLPPLGCAAGAPSLAPAFHLPVPG